MAEEEETVLELYHDEIKRISVEQQSSTAVLYCCVLAVINHTTVHDPEQNKAQHSTAPISDVYLSTGHFASLQINGSSGSFQGLVQSVYAGLSTDSNAITVDCDDVASTKLARGIEDSKTTSSNKSDYMRASLAGMVLFEKQAIVRGQIATLLAGQQFPIKPVMTSTERGIKETELLSFSSLSSIDLYRNDQMQTAANMLQAYVKALPNFTGTLLAGGDDGAITRRRYFRQLSAQTFAQILSAERVREPVVVKQYYELTDDLLLALHWPPPERRIRKETWSWTGPIPVLTSAAPVVQKEKSVKAKKGKADKKKPPVKSAKKGAVEPVAPTTVTCTISTTTLTPAAHSIALIKRASDPTALGWLTVHVNGSVLGLRLETCSILTADFLAEQDHESHREQKSVFSARSHESLDLGAGGEEGVASPGGSIHSAHPGDASHADSHHGEAQHGDAQHGDAQHSDAHQGDGHLDSGHKVGGVSSSSSLYHDPPRGMFFCHTEDDVRFSACAGPCPMPIRKPDGFGSICLLATFPDTMTLTVCSNGTTKIGLPQLPVTPALQGKQIAAAPVAGGVPVFDSAVGIEVDRFIGSGGTVMSLYNRSSASFTSSDGSQVQFWKEIRAADGSRLLIVRTAYGHGGVPASLANAFSGASIKDGNPVASKKGSSAKFSGLQSFYEDLCGGAPLGWTCVNLAADGSVVFHTCPPDSSLLDSSEGIPHSALHGQMRQSLVDAETRSTVSTYPDGRIVVQYPDGRRESKFGDGTIITTHAEGAMVSVTKPGLPAVEMDTEIDAVSRQHARGIEVPINKGGERVRSRIALPDGTAILVKYDTRLTATTNGSIKLVRRDKTVILLKDSGSITYTPRAAWNSKAAATFAAECADLPKPAEPVGGRSVTMGGGATTAALSTAGRTSPTNRSMTSGAPRSPTSHSTALRSADTSASRNGRNQKTISAPGLITRRKNSPSRGQSKRSGTTPAEPETTTDEGAEEATFFFDITKFTCRILDYEFNSFDIALTGEDPLSPGVTLSGEVAGLKPPAVADKPMEPRLFVVNRSAEATELLSSLQVSAAETLVRTCPDVTKLTAPVHLQPSELGPATLNKYFIKRRLLGPRGDAFNFEEVFGERYWYPHHSPAAALLAEHNNRTTALKQFKKKKSSAGQNAVPPPARFYETLSVVEQLPLSQEGHVELKKALQKCEAFRAGRLQSLDRFKVEEDRSKEELDEEEALAKRLKLAFKAAKVMAAKKKEQKAKLAAAQAPAEEPSTGPSPLSKHANEAIMEGANEDGEEEDDVDFPADDDEPEELNPEEMEVREAFDDFSEQAATEGFVVDDCFTINKSCLQDAFVRLFNRYIAPDVIEHEIALCEECDGGFDELTFPEFSALYFSMKANFAAEASSPSRTNLRISTVANEAASVPSQHSDEHSVISSPMFWQSSQGKKVSLPPAAPPLDLRKLEWNAEDDAPLSAGQGVTGMQAFGESGEFDDGFVEMQNGLQGRMVSTAHPAVGSALQAARRSNSNRAVTAPE